MYKNLIKTKSVIKLRNLLLPICTKILILFCRSSNFRVPTTLITSKVNQRKADKVNTLIDSEMIKYV